METSVQAIVSHALYHDGRTRVKVDVEVVRWTRTDSEVTACNLAGRDFHSGLRFTGQLQSMDAVVRGQYHAVHGAVAFVSRDVRVIGSQQNAKLLIAAGLQLGCRSQRCQETLFVCLTQQINLLWTVLQTGS